MMKQTQPRRRMLAALLCTFLLALQFTPVLAAEFVPDVSSPEQPIISLYWQDQNGEMVTVPALYQGMINGMHAYWLQITDPFVIQNRLGSIMYTISDQDEFDILTPDQTVGINFTDMLDLPMTITNTTQQRSWILTVSTLPMPAPEPTPELVIDLEPTPEPTIELEPTLEPVIEPDPTPEPAIEPEPTPEPVIEPDPTAVPATEQPAPQDTPVPAVEPTVEASFNAYAEVNVKTEANLRSIAGGTGKDTVISTVAGGTLVHIVGKVDVSGSEFPWYRLEVLKDGQPNGTEGYMRGDLLKVLSDEEAAQRLQATQGGAEPTAEPLPTEEPQATEEPQPEPPATEEPVLEPTPEPTVDASVVSYAVALKNANVRNAAGATSPESAIAVLYADDLTYVDGSVTLPDNSWYRVQLLEKGLPTGVSGFVRGDLLSLIDEQTAQQRLQDADAQPLQQTIQSLTGDTLEIPPYTGYALTVTKPLGDFSPLMLAPGDPNGSIEELGGDVILYVDSELDVDGVKWYAVHSPVVDTRVGYMLASDLIVPVTEEQAQPYLIPVEPTEEPAPEPTLEPTQELAPEPTPDPTSEPTSEPTPEPTPRIPGPVPSEEGVVERYGNTNVAGVNVRSDLSTSSSTVETVKLGTVVWVSEMHKSGSDMWYKVVVMNNGKQGTKGYILTNLVDLMNDEELAKYLESQPNTPTAKPTAEPTATPVPTPTLQPTIFVPTTAPVTQAPPVTATPTPIEGHYAITTVNNVPLRGNPNEMAILQDVLSINTIVFVRTQAYDEQGRKWHLVQHGSTMGYVLDPLLRFLSGEEEKDYISHISTPPPVYTAAPVTSNSPSSYGQVRNDNVNLRSAPSTSASILMTLKKGTLALILGNMTSENAIWYRVDVAGTVGYLRSDLLNTLTITQVYDLLYNQQNTGGSGGSNSGGSGNVNVTIPSTPKNNGELADLIAIEGGWTNGIIEGLPFDTSSPAPSETPLPSETPDPFAASDDLFSSALPIDDQTQGTQRSPVLLLVAGITLMGGAAGVYGYALHQNNKKKAAARAAAQRAHAAQGAQPGQRRAVTQPVPRDGSPTSTIMGNTGRVPPVGGAKPEAGIGGAAGAAGVAGAAASQRSQQQRPPAPGQQTVPPSVNPYARPAAPQQSQSSPQTRPAQPQGQGSVRPAQGQEKPPQGTTPPSSAQKEPPRRARSQRPRDEDLDV